MLQHRQYFQSRTIYGADMQDIAWFEPSGQEMSGEAWNTGHVRCPATPWCCPGPHYRRRRRRNLLPLPQEQSRRGKKECGRRVRRVRNTTYTALRCLGSHSERALPLF